MHHPSEHRPSVPLVEPCLLSPRLLFPICTVKAMISKLNLRICALNRVYRESRRKVTVFPCSGITIYPGTANNKQENHVLLQILWLLGPNEFIAKLNSHPLLGLRSSPLAQSATVSRYPGNWLLLNVTADSDDSHIVQALEVVAHVELVEIEGDTELRIARREVGGSDKGNCEFRSIVSCVISA